MNRAEAVALLDALHAAQNEFYGGGSDAELRRLIAPDVVWTIPGASPIAGTYRGIDEVFAYFARRRDLASGTFQMHRRDVLVGETVSVCALTDGTASIGGREHQWSTVGLYEITEDSQISACWLLALDQSAFDALWASCTTGDFLGAQASGFDSFGLGVEGAPPDHLLVAPFDREPHRALDRCPAPCTTSAKAPAHESRVAKVTHLVLLGPEIRQDLE